jgi:hypothetical protein
MSRPVVASRLVAIIESDEPAIRNQSLESVCDAATADELLAEAAALEAFRHASTSLYHRVRALFFLAGIHRFHLPARLSAGGRAAALIPHAGYDHLLHRRFEEAIAEFLESQRDHGPSDAISSALAVSYRELGLQTLANQVRKSVRSLRGNQWMFRVGHPADHALRIRPELLARSENGTFPLLRESTPVRMDLSHSCWSDVFFLGMDYPEGARVLNVSIDLGVHGRDATPKPRPICG